MTMTDINAVFDEFDENLICVSDFNILFRSVKVDYIYRTDDKNIQIWAGNPFCKYSEELVLSKKEKRRILEEILDNF